MYSLRITAVSCCVVLVLLLVGGSFGAPHSARAQTTSERGEVAVLLAELQTLLAQLHTLSPLTTITSQREVTAIATSTLTRAQMEERIVYLQKKIVQIDAEVASSNAELATLRTELAAALAAFDGVTTPTVVVPPVVTPVPVAETYAAYKALTGTYVLESKDSVTQTEALKYCMATVSANPTKTIWCSWNAQVISGRKPSTYVLGASTSSEIEVLNDAIGRLERRLAVLLPRKAEYEKEIAALQIELARPVVTVPPVVVPPPVIPVIPPVVVPVTPSPLVTPITCGSKPYLRKIVVTNVLELKSALLAAMAGDYIAITAGTYNDTFVIENKIATPALPISICGETGVIFRSAKGYVGYGMYLKNDTNIILSNVAVTGYLKGVMLDNTQSSRIEHVTVSDIGNEGIHLRQNSSNNIVQYSTIFNTGIVQDWYGEGVYIGSANSNWCTYTNCAPDKSDWNQVLNNDILNTAAESVDIKEGTTGGIIIGNRFEGSGMTGEYADSFVDVKGNNYILKGNSGKVGVSSTNVPYQLDAYQEHVVYTGYGNNNLFETNTVTGTIAGYVVYLMSSGVGNIVMCDNSALTKAKGITNIGVCKL